MMLKNRTSGVLRIGNRAFTQVTLICAFIIVAILVNILVVLTLQAWPAIREFGAPFLSSSTWDPVKNEYGALPAIYGTLISSLLALVIAVPLSIGAAIFLVELSPAWIRGPASFIIEMLAAIPSVIIGLWGLFVLVPFVRSPIESWLGTHLGSLSFFQGPPFGFGFLAAAIILAIMIIPIITAMSRDVLRAVPSTQREAMLALGATRWETISRAVLPYGRSGLVGAVLLGLSRALGETMAVTMVIGNGNKITASLFSPGTTIPSKIANEFGEASGIGLSSLIELALILFVITLLVNVIARLLVWRLTAGKMARE
ncbi:MAG: phosphate ABC transporter permease subunit PstC [Dehalococcoidia bacterium]|nr:MAG: phosphate ABC transporter permease subunit PstC [Dehalococcoidia bacterium]